MDCEFTVELGADDPTLAVPWHSPDGKIVYVDLRAHPNAIDQLEEVRAFPELGDILRSLNRGEFATAKCDAWFDTLMDIDDEPYEAKWKCGSYIDVFFADDRRFSGFEFQEQFARELVKRIRRSEDIAGRCEIALRRAWFEDREGFYWTVYVFGYGEQQDSAEECWAKCLKTIANILNKSL